MSICYFWSSSWDCCGVSLAGSACVCGAFCGRVVMLCGLCGRRQWQRGIWLVRALATQLCCCDAVAASMGWRWLLATAYAAGKKLKATRTKRLKCIKEA